MPLPVRLFGGGRQGKAIAYFLRKHDVKVEIVEASYDRVAELRDEGYAVIHQEISLSCMRELMHNCDLVVSALPARLGKDVIDAGVSAGCNVVDVSYSSFLPLEYDSRAQDAGVTVVFDAGIAPGISNLVVGMFDRLYGPLQEVKIFVGGIPRQNVPPLGYTITWSVEDLIEEYTRPARIKVDGEVIDVPALSGRELLEWKGIGELEAFYTDGLRSLLYTLPHVRDMEEKTLRYPGHCDKIGLLKSIGLFEREIEYRGSRLYPRSVIVPLLEMKLKADVEDVLLIRVEVKGKKRAVWELECNAEGGFSAMERSTGFSCGAFAMALLTGKVERQGVVAPEEIGRMCGEYVLHLLEEEGIKGRLME